MKRIPHLVWFDMLALRVPLAVWGAFLLVEGTFFYLGPVEPSGLPEFGRLTVTVGLTMARWVASVVIIALLIHADPTVGTAAFWRSRPISRFALLASKLTSVLLWFIVLPGIVTTVVLCLLGMDLAAAIKGGSMTSYEQAVIVFMALAFVIVTKDLVQFVVAVVFGIGITWIFNQALLPAALSMWPALETSLAYWPRMGFDTVVIGLAGFIAIYHYLTLRVRYSIAMLACAVVFAGVVPRLGARASGEPQRWPEPVPTSLIRPSDVVLSIVPGTQLESQASRFVNGKTTAVRGVSFEAITSDEPEAMTIDPVELRSRLEFSDHSVVRGIPRWPMEPSPVSGTRARVTVSDQPYRSIWQALGNPELVLPPSFMRTPHRLAVLEIPDEQFQRYRGQSARLDANITMLARRYRVMAAAPLRAGGRISIANGGVASVESVSRTASGITVVVRQTYLENLKGSYPTGVHQFILRNTTRRLALLGSRSGFRLAAYTMYFGTSRVMTVVYQLFFSAPDAPAGGPGMDDEWMKNAELVRLDMTTLGTITRPLRIENFVLGTEQKK